MNKVKNVVIIGVGAVGATIAYSLVLKNICDFLYLIDVNEKKIEAEMKDLHNAFSKTQVIKGKYTDCLNANLIIVTAGRNRKIGENRLDLCRDNLKIIEDISNKIKKYYNECPIIIVSNPVDLLVRKCCEIFENYNSKIIGTGCVLDSSRLINILANYFHVNKRNIHAFVIGEHGDRQHILWNEVTIFSMKIDDYCKKNNLVWNQKIKGKIEDDLRSYGADIIEKKGLTHFGIALCIDYMTFAILNNKSVVLSVSSAQNDFNNIAFSIPSKINTNGIVEKEIIEKNEYEYIKNTALFLNEMYEIK